MKKNSTIIILILGIILGVALSANVPSVVDQFANLQAQLTGGGGGGYGGGGGW